MFESPLRSGYQAATLAALTVMAIQFSAVLQPDAIPFDSEELYNAAHARLIQLEHGSRWLDLQYRGYCGGCTVNAGLGAIMFSLFGASLAAWKLVPILFIGLMTFFGAKALHSTVGGVAVLPWTALLCFTPPTFLELSMTAWGNHFESGVAAIIVLTATLNLARGANNIRAAFVGLSLAFALWIGLSSAFLLLGVVVSLWRTLHRSHWAAILVGVSPIVGLWSYQWANAPSPPFETIYYAGEQIPRLTRIPEKIWSLIAPRQLVALFGIRGDISGWILGWSSAATLAIGVWKSRSLPSLRPALWFLLSFLTVYSLVRFTVWAPPAPEVAPPGSMRYAAPMYGLLFFLLSAAVGLFWRQKRRAVAIALLCPALSIGLHTRATQLQDPFPDRSVFDMAAPDFDYARDQISYLLPLAVHRNSESDDPMVTALHDFSIAWHETRKVLDHDPSIQLPVPTRNTVDAWEGVTAAVLPEVDPDQNGGIRTLVHLHERIDHFPETAQPYMHAEATSRRNWHEDLPEHDDTRLMQWATKIGYLPAAAQQGAMMSFGRRWAADIARWRSPQYIQFPTLSMLPPKHQEAFMEGFGITIGERWGPNHASMEKAVPSHLEAAWTKGRNRGVKKRWLTRTR